MSEQQTTNVEQATANAVDTTQEQSIETLSANVGEAETPVEINARLLHESKTNKEKLQRERSLRLSERKELETLKTAKAEDDGRWKDLYESEKSRREVLEGGLVQRDVEKAVREKALVLGCVNIDSLMKLGDSELLQWDEGQVEGVDTFLESARQKHGYLFSSAKTPTINPSTPSGVVPRVAKVVNQLSDDELTGQLVEVERRLRSN